MATLSNDTFSFTDLTNGGSGGALATGLYTLISTDISSANPFAGLGAGNTITGLSTYTAAGDTATLQIGTVAGNYALQLNIVPGAVPEPGTRSLLLIGLGLMAGSLRLLRLKS